MELEVFEKIDLYLKGKLDPDDNFHQALLHDKELKEMVELEVITNQFIKENAIINATNHLTYIHNEANNLNKLKARVYKITALVVTLGLIGTFIIKNLNDTIDQKTNTVIPSKTKKDTLTIQKLPNNKESNGVNKNAVFEKVVNERSKDTLPNPVRHISNDLIEIPKPVLKASEKVKEQGLLNELSSAPTSLKVEKNIDPIIEKKQINTDQLENKIEKKAANKPESYVFEPNRETWRIPTNPEKKGKLTVLNKAGIEVFKKTFVENEEITWNGFSLAGELVQEGLYPFYIEYQDGEISYATVTIVF